MNQTATAVLAFIFIVGVAAVPVELPAAQNDYETLEFFLDQSLKRIEDPRERAEVLNRYLIKALGLVYEQNKELIRLQRDALLTLQELKQIEAKETRELEMQMQRN